MMTVALKATVVMVIAVLLGAFMLHAQRLNAGPTKQQEETKPIWSQVYDTISGIGQPSTKEETEREVLILQKNLPKAQMDKSRVTTAAREEAEAADEMHCATCEKIDQAREAVKEGAKEGARHVHEAVSSAGQAAKEEAEAISDDVSRAAAAARRKVHHTAERVQEGANKAKATVADAAGRLGENIKASYEKVRNKAGDLAHDAAENLNEAREWIADKVQEQWQRAEESIEETAREAREVGKERMREAKEAANWAEHRIREKADTASSRLGSATEKVKREEDIWRDSARRTAEQAGDALRQAARKASEAWEDTKNEAHDSLTQGADKASETWEETKNEASRAWNELTKEARPLREKAEQLKADLQSLDPLHGEGEHLERIPDQEIHDKAASLGDRIRRSVHDAEEATEEEAHRIAQGARGIWERAKQGAKNMGKSLKDVVSGAKHKVEENLDIHQVVKEAKEAYNQAKVGALQAMKRATKRVEGTEKAISAATKQRSELSMKEALHFAEEAEHQADVLLEILRSVRSSDYERTKPPVAVLAYNVMVKEAEDAKIYITRMRMAIADRIGKGTAPNQEDEWKWSDIAKEDLLRNEAPTA